jgi:two-component sensor histidine kinase
MNAHFDHGTKRTQMLLRGLSKSQLALMYHDDTLAVTLIDNTPASWPAPEEILARGDAAIFEPGTAELVERLKRHALETGEPDRIEAAVRRCGAEPVWFDLHIEPDRDASGKVIGLFVSAADITEHKRREESLRALLYEVSHRSRNLLAIFQSILGQTVRHAGSIDAFERKFRGRILSLAHSQDLITQSEWEGVRFRALFDRQISGFVVSGARRPLLLGDDPILSPNEALHIGLALHELAVNSSDCGVFGTGGRIVIEAETRPRGNRLTWTEELATPAGVPAASGFGRAVLERVVPHAIGGRARHEVAPGRVVYGLHWPCSVPKRLPDEVKRRPVDDPGDREVPGRRYSA